jgi:hypothetical protein
MQDTGSPKYDFDAFLMSREGKSYDLAPKDRFSRPIFMNLMTGINSNKTYECNMSINADTNISAGLYDLKVTRVIYIQHSKYLLTSNPVSVTVVRGR